MIFLMIAFLSSAPAPSGFWSLIFVLIHSPGIQPPRGHIVRWLTHSRLSWHTAFSGRHSPMVDTQSIRLVHSLGTQPIGHTVL
ncbi:uncharacterized protein BCR38DRAFT_442350 [Pseudomassariella vexata]|uniref:Secreted protein n=1 Tax=Pseudomassariella vexata TaxID=1141098 RepID=A0A1Y2DQ00_9PEZI|nr:uncharacterized protein BCR38DRAFT_442350 [Pseudomassariella vexata]ORY60735.1 hypothetical protein BCR38DRAFT_442350 [Pseudomassariella vexata]